MVKVREAAGQRGRSTGHGRGCGRARRHKAMSGAARGQDHASLEGISDEDLLELQTTGELNDNHHTAADLPTQPRPKPHSKQAIPPDISTPPSMHVSNPMATVSAETYASPRPEECQGTCWCPPLSVI